MYVKLPHQQKSLVMSPVNRIVDNWNYTIVPDLELYDLKPKDEKKMKPMLKMHKTPGPQRPP